MTAKRRPTNRLKAPDRVHQAFDDTQRAVHTDADATAWHQWPHCCCGCCVSAATLIMVVQPADCVDVYAADSRLVSCRPIDRQPLPASLLSRHLASLRSVLPQPAVLGSSNSTAKLPLSARSRHRIRWQAGRRSVVAYTITSFQSTENIYVRSKKMTTAKEKTETDVLVYPTAKFPI